MTGEDDKCRAALRLPEYLQRIFDTLNIVGIADPQDVPPIAEEPRSDVFSEGDARASLDRDMVVVVNPTQIIEPQMACKGGGFRPDALHQTAVATHRIDVIVKDFESRLVITAAKPAPCNRHADAHGNSLTKWSGSGLDSRDQVVLGMAWCLAAELPESTNVIKRHRRPSQFLIFRVDGLNLGKVQYRPKKHRGVAVGKYESVSVGPGGILRIESHHAVPESVDQRRECHRRARVTGIGGLHCVHRQGSDRIDR